MVVGRTTSGSSGLMHASLSSCTAWHDARVLDLYLRCLRLVDMRYRLSMTC